MRFGNRLHPENASYVAARCGEKAIYFKNALLKYGRYRKFEIYPQAKHSSHYMRAKRGVISSPGMAATAKNLNFCILGIFLYIRPTVFLASGWRRKTKFGTQK